MLWRRVGLTARMVPVEPLIGVGLVLMVAGITLGSFAFACAGSLVVVGPAAIHALVAASRGSSPTQVKDVQSSSHRSRLSDDLPECS